MVGRRGITLRGDPSGQDTLVEGTDCCDNLFFWFGELSIWLETLGLCLTGLVEHYTVEY